MLENNPVKPLNVKLQYTETLTSKRRDFRWIFDSNNNTEACTLPFIPVPKGFLLKHSHNPKDDNEADAIALLYYAINKESK